MVPEAALEVAPKGSRSDRRFPSYRMLPPPSEVGRGLPQGPDGCPVLEMPSCLDLTGPDDLRCIDSRVFGSGERYCLPPIKDGGHPAWVDDFGALVSGNFGRLKSLRAILTAGGPPRVNVTRSVHGGTRCEWIIRLSRFAHGKFLLRTRRILGSNDEISLFARLFVDFA